MTDGDLKNTPSAALPNNATPRFFMEEFGYFMGVTLGPQWTIGAELDLIEQAAAREGRELRVILESIVYEVDYLRQRGPITVIEIARLQADPTIQAHRTDAAGRDIIPDLKFRNDGEDLAALHRDIDEMMRERFGMEPDRLPEPAF